MDESKIVVEEKSSDKPKEMNMIKEKVESYQKETDSGWKTVVQSKNSRQCCLCGGVYNRTDFSQRQWNKGKTNSKCKSCSYLVHLQYEETCDQCKETQSVVDLNGFD